MKKTNNATKKMLEGFSKIKEAEDWFAFNEFYIRENTEFRLWLDDNYKNPLTKWIAEKIFKNAFTSGYFKGRMQGMPNTIKIKRQKAYENNC